MLKKIFLAILINSILIETICATNNFSSLIEDNRPNQVFTANSYEDGMDLLCKGEISSAIGHFAKAYEEGDVRAALKLAVIHENGIGVPKNLFEAVKIYKKLFAKEGYTNYTLIPKSSLKKYIELNKYLINENEDIQAMINLADYYMSVISLWHNKLFKVLDLYEKILDKKEASTQQLGYVFNCLGALYENRIAGEYNFENPEYNGICITKKIEKMVEISIVERTCFRFFNIKALILYKKAYDLGNNQAKENLDRLCNNFRKGFDTNNAKRLFFKDEVFEDFQSCQALLELIQGGNIKENEVDERLKTASKSENYYDERETSDYVVSSYILGWMYEYGYQVQKDLLKAFQYYSNCYKMMWYDKDDPYHTNGKFLKFDWDRVRKKLLNKLDPRTEFEIAYQSMLINHEEINARELWKEFIQKLPKNNKLSKKELELNQKALFNLAWMYEHGKGGKKDLEMALKRFKESADLGYEDAKKILDEYDKRKKQQLFLKKKHFSI